MRIVFDAYWWTTGPPSLRHVVRETVIAWHQQFPDDDILIVVPSRDAKQARSDVPPGIQVRGTRLWPQALLATVACKWAARKFAADVIFTQNFAASTGRASVVFIHDVLFLTNPEWFSWTERRYFALMPRLATRADVVLTSSSTEADRIRRNSRARRVVPVGIGLSSELIDNDEFESLPDLQPSRFLLTVGRLNVRKNLGTTVAAAIQSGRIDSERPLVVVGSANGRRESLPPWMASAVASGSVRFTGHVSDAQLRWLYSNTALFLFMSRGEGFGMPSMEALHFGAPMIVSDIDVFREIVPDSVPRIPPEDSAAIAAAIRSVLDAPRNPGRESAVSIGPVYNWRGTVAAMRVEAARVVHEGRQLRTPGEVG